MNTLLSVNVNPIYRKDDTDAEKYHKHLEFVILVDQPHYLYSNAGEIVRERQIGELRFNIADVNYDKFIDLLHKLRNAKPDELG